LVTFGNAVASHWRWPTSDNTVMVSFARCDYSDIGISGFHMHCRTFR
jgi:hypothetical protein